jgi:2-polyprenyl-3-methyl-5-hydroxy-6-metoxy-1,4-benzoquinol methylase
MGLEYFSYTRGEMIAFVPQSAKIVLEVGCGIGLFTKTLQQQRPHTIVVGVEPHAPAAQEAAKNLNACYALLFDESTAAILKNDYQQGFDAIVFNDVLEHLTDPWQALELCRGLLAPNGVVVASIPNILYFHAFFKMLFSKDWKYEDGGIFDKTHLRFFTRKSIERMFDECKFEISQIQGIHATDSKKMTLFNLFTFGKWSEMRYMQWAVQAKLK